LTLEPGGSLYDLSNSHAAQAAVMPVLGRTYPYGNRLAHDVARWYADGRGATGERRALVSVEN
jgi:hypothetical protein